MIAKYHTLEDVHDEKEHDHSPIFNIYLLRTDSDEEIESSQAINPSGRANFIIQESKYIINSLGASYRICLIPNEESIIFKKRDSLKLSISFESTDNDLFPQDLSKVPKNTDFEKINKKIERVQKKVFEIMRLQKYQIFKEDEFSNRNLKNSSIIVYFTVIQIIILFALTIWQIYSFKSLFREKLNLK